MSRLFNVLCHPPLSTREPNIMQHIEMRVIKLCLNDQLFIGNSVQRLRRERLILYCVQLLGHTVTFQSAIFGNLILVNTWRLLFWPIRRKLNGIDTHVFVYYEDIVIIASSRNDNNLPLQPTPPDPSSCVLFWGICFRRFSFCAKKHETNIVCQNTEIPGVYTRVSTELKVLVDNHNITVIQTETHHVVLCIIKQVFLSSTSMWLRKCVL